jgi:L-aminopeptidase/D-esterase-like protein
MTYVDVRGGWPGTVNTNLSNNDDSAINGICFAGGSLLGEEAIVGVSKGIFKKSNYTTWQYVAGAIIYSGNLSRNKIYPDLKLGEFAYNNLSKNSFPLGQAGAGCSAGAGQYGQGCAYKELDNGIKILIFTVLNAVGDIYDNDGKLYKTKNKKSNKKGRNTTLTLFVTNVDLSHPHLKQLVNQVHTSMSRWIRPYNTLFDGDTFFGVTKQTLKLQFTKPIWVEFLKESEQLMGETILSAC